MNIQALFNILTPEDKAQLKLLLDRESKEAFKKKNRLPTQKECDTRVFQVMSRKKK